MAKAMRVEIGQVIRFEGLLVDRPNRPRVAPVFAVEANCLKAALIAQPHQCFWKERAIRSPQHVRAQMLAPVGDNLERIAAHCAKPCREGFAAFCLNLPRILKDAALLHVDVL